MVEAKTTKKAATKTVAAETKKTTAKRCCAKKPVVALTTENVGFKAGDVYQALAATGGAMSVAEIAKVANICNEETLLGIGWLFKEGKIIASGEKITLA